MPNKKVDMDLDLVRELLKARVAMKEISTRLKINYRTLRERLRKEGLLPKQRNESISDEDLCKAMEEVKTQFPKHGLQQIMGALSERGIRVSRDRVWRILQLLDPEGILERGKMGGKRKRQVYHSDFCHQSWHVDTCLKLGRYKIVIRGGVDGHSRAIVFLEAGLDNTGNSNLEAFIRATSTYGIPVHLRTDKGKENIKCAAYMIKNRGPGMRSTITGSSHTNTRIERLWADVGPFVLRKYRAWFQSLEKDGQLNVADPVCLASLHAVFLGPLRHDLKTYMTQWQSKKIRTMGYKTPLAMMLESPMPPEKVLPHTMDASIIPDEIIDSLRSMFDTDPVDETGETFNEIRVDEHIKDLVKPAYIAVKQAFDEQGSGGNLVEIYKAVVAAAKVAHKHTCDVCPDYDL